MRFKTTWILAALLVLVAAYFLVEERRKEAGERERIMSRRLLPYDKEAVERFTLINPKGERIEIERSYDGWKIVSPVITDGSRATIDAILMQLLPGRKLDSFEDVGSLSDYGLETPYATVIFHSSGRMSPDTIFVGDKTPTSPSCYIRIGSGDTVLVAREMTHNVVNKNLYHLRDKNFLHLASEAIDSLRIEKEDHIISLSRRDGWWWMDDPPGRAEQQKVESYLKALTLAIVRGFPGEDLMDLDRFGLVEPSRRLVLVSGQDEIEISFGDLFEDQVHVLRTGLDKVLLLEQQVLEPFGWELEDVMSRKLSFFEPSDVARITIETPESRLSIEKRPEGWRLGEAPVQPAKVQTFLRMLRTISFESIDRRGSGDPFALTAPFSMRISLETVGGFTVERISLFRTDDEVETAVSLSSDALGPVGTGTIADLERMIESD